MVRSRLSEASRLLDPSGPRRPYVPPQAAGWDRGFESGSLQRRVTGEPFLSEIKSSSRLRNQNGAIYLSAPLVYRHSKPMTLAIFHSSHLGRAR
jgi:hypothetical protein